MGRVYDCLTCVRLHCEHAQTAHTTSAFIQRWWVCNELFTNELWCCSIDVYPFGYVSCLTDSNNVLKAYNLYGIACTVFGWRGIRPSDVSIQSIKAPKPIRFEINTPQTVDWAIVLVCNGSLWWIVRWWKLNSLCIFHVLRFCRRLWFNLKNSRNFIF